MIKQKLLMKKNTISIITLIGFAVLSIIFLKGRTHELVKILEVNLKYIIFILILVGLSSLLNGHKLKMLMEAYDVRLRFKEWWGLQIITLFWNDLTPFKGGLPIRAVYLKKKYGFSYTHSVTTTGLAYFTDFLILGLAGVVLSFFLQVSNQIKYGVFIFFLIIFLSSVIILFFLPLPIKLNIRILKHVINSINEFQRVRQDYLLFLKLSFNFIERWTVGALRLYFAFLAFGTVVSLYSCLMIDLFVSIAMVVSITPMNLGFRESVVAVSSKLFSTSGLIGIFVAVLDRAIALVWTFASTPIFSYILMKDFKPYKGNDKEIVSRTKGKS